MIRCVTIFIIDFLVGADGNTKYVTTKVYSNYSVVSELNC